MRSVIIHLINNCGNTPFTVLPRHILTVHSPQSATFRKCMRTIGSISTSFHDDVIKWKHFLRYWPCVQKRPHKGQWRGALMFSLICIWINGWVNNREAGNLRRYRVHYDVTVMPFYDLSTGSFRRIYFIHIRDFNVIYGSGIIVFTRSYLTRFPLFRGASKTYMSY